MDLVQYVQVHKSWKVVQNVKKITKKNAMIYKSHKAAILFTIEQRKQMFKLEKCTNI